MCHMFMHFLACSPNYQIHLQCYRVDLSPGSTNSIAVHVPELIYCYALVVVVGTTYF